MEQIDYELLYNKFRETGLSYEGLAKETDVCRGTLHNVMYGITKPSYQVASRLVRVLLLTPEEITAIFFPNGTYRNGAQL